MIVSKNNTGFITSVRFEQGIYPASRNYFSIRLTPHSKRTIADAYYPERALASRRKSTALHAGFTLIEVLLAMAIIGLVLTPIFMGQSAILRATALASRRLARVFAAKKILIENEITLEPDVREYSSEKKINNPPTTFTYELKKISDDSSLKKFKNVLIQTVSWPDERSKKKRHDRLVTFLYRPEKQ